MNHKQSPPSYCTTTSVTTRLRSISKIFPLPSSTLSGCKWCQIPVEEITNLDKKMNGAALERRYGALSAAAIFKREGWETAPSAPPPTPANTPTKQTKTTELVEKWKLNRAPKKPRSRENDANCDDSKDHQLSVSQHMSKKARHEDDESSAKDK